MDTEVTGLSVDVHEINQISVQRVSDAKQYSAQIKVKKPHVYNYKALEVQGIHPSQLKVGIPVEQAVQEIDEFLSEDEKTKAHRCIVAHNAPFDRKFIHRAWDVVKKEFLADLWICTQSLAHRYVKKHGKTKIAQTQKNAGVDLKVDKKGMLKPKFGLTNFMLGVGLTPKLGSHQAHVDVQNTLELFNWFLNSSRTEYLSLIERIPHKKEPPIDYLDIEDC